LVSALSKLDANVVVVVRDDVSLSSIHETWWSKVTRVRGDVCDQEFMERVLAESEVSTLLHLAAQTQVGVANANPISSFDSNIRGTWATLEAVRRSSSVGETVVASSDKAYGTQAILPYHEGMALQAVHPYDVSKAAADMIATSYAHSFGLNLAITRCGNFYGPGDTNWERLIPGTIRLLLDGQRPVIRSDGSLIRDYLYVEDGVRGYLQLAESLAAHPDLCGQAFNFSAERPLTVLEVVDFIQKAAGTSLAPDIRANSPGEISHQYLSAEKARTVLKWASSYTFEEGLDLTLDWYRATLGK
jgi:CDP-glucose 4,6-dehydratase